MDFKDKLLELKETKICKVLTLIAKTLLGLVILGFVLVVLLQRFSNNRLSLFNYRMFTVITGSMAPKYNVGDVLIAKYVDVDKIKQGDTISYFGEPGTNMEDRVITHEVVSDGYDEETETFVTKGIQNIVQETVKSDRYLGVIVSRSKFLTTLYAIINTNVGFYFLIIIPFMYVIGSEILAHLLAKAEEKYTE